MGYREVTSAAKRLPLGEQLQLVEELPRAMRQTTAKPGRPKRRRTTPFTQLRGALKPEGPLPTDGEVEDVYIKHLIEKYL
jgi:hypothetical protein